MKKYFIALCAVSVVLLSFALTACGSTYAKVVGIYAVVGTDKNDMFGNDSPSEEKEGAEVYYNLTCKKSISYTAVIIEVDEYTYTVIISSD